MSQPPFKIPVNTWNFSNSSFQKYRYKLPIFPYLKLGKAERGLCGGMVFSALDYYYSNKSIPEIKSLNINDKDQIFRYIVKRLFDSFGIKAVLTYYYLQLPIVKENTLNKHTSKQLDKILSKLKKEIPVPVTLILVKTYNPDRLGENHQVLLTQIHTLREELIEIKVYDPNYPKTERILSIYLKNKIPTHIEMNGDRVYALHSIKYKAKAV